MNQSARYSLEHEVLPQVLFSPDGASLVQKIVNEKGDFLSRFYNKYVFDGEGEKGYPASQFAVYPFMLSDELAAVRIEPPAPERPPLCHYIYILHSVDFKSFRYFTVERAPEGTRILGEWTPDRMHNDYGEVGGDSEEHVMAIADILLPKTPQC